MAQVKRRSALGLLALLGALALICAHPVLAEEDRWVRLTSMQPPRRLLAAAAAADGKIYTFGGCGSPCFEPPLHTSTDEETRVQVYDPSTDTWQEKKRMSAILFGAAAASVGRKGYTFGGYVTPNLTQEYNPDSDTEPWTKKRPMPTPRHGLAAVAFKDKIYVLGGSDGKSPSDALEIYHPETNTW